MRPEAPAVPAYVRWLAQAGIFFALMPYIGIGALPSDTQPFAFLAAALGLVLLWRTPPRVAYLTLPLIVMAVLATVSLILRGAFDDIGYLWLIRSYYGYVSAPVIVTFFLYYLRVLRNDQIARVVDVALVVAFLGFVLNVLGFTWVIQSVVNRAVFVGAAASSRGIPSFFVEQSRVSEQMAFFFFCYLLTGQVTRLRAAALVVAALLAAAGQMFIIAGHIVLAYAAAAAVLVLVRRGISVRSATRLTLAGAVVVAFVSFHEVIAADLIRIGFPTRGITAISSIIDRGGAFIGRDQGMMDKLAGILQAAATLVDNPVTFKLAATADPGFRATVEPTYAYLSRILFDSTLLRFARRPSTALGLWVLEFGIVGLIAALTFVVLLLRRAVGAPNEVQVRVLWASFFLAQVLFVKLTLANPSLWLMSALIWAASRPSVSGLHLAVRRPDATLSGKALHV